VLAKAGSCAARWRAEWEREVTEARVERRPWCRVVRDPSTRGSPRVEVLAPTATPMLASSAAGGARGWRACCSTSRARARSSPSSSLACLTRRVERWREISLSTGSRPFRSREALWKKEEREYTHATKPSTSSQFRPL
jgi:hypothetical protein